MFSFSTTSNIKKQIFSDLSGGDIGVKERKHRCNIGFTLLSFAILSYLKETGTLK